MEQTTFLSSPGSLIALILGIIAFSLWLQKFKITSLLGPSLLVIIFGIIASNAKIVPSMTELYGILAVYCIPISMSLFLMNIDFSQLKDMTKEPVISLISAIFSVGVIAFLFGLFFAEKIPEGWKVAGMFVGTYTGGSSNLTAIAIALEASNETIVSANAADYVIGIPSMILMFAAPAILKSSAFFNKIWPYKHTEDELYGYDLEHKSLFSAKEWSIMDIAMLLTVSFTIVQTANFISTTFFPESMYKSAIRILLITTVSAIIGQLPFIKILKGKLDLGLLIAMIYLTIIGFMVDISGFLTSTASITIFCACVILFSTLLHLLITRFFKIRYEFVVISIVAAIADGTTAALVCSNGKWKSLIPIALISGVLAGLIGNYLGISVAYMIKAAIGA
ncbi:MAG: DUF819 family protein [Peptoanaerobacter stomatis]